MTGANGGGAFNRARTIGGLLLLVLVAVLFILDWSSAEFTIDTMQLGLVLGTALPLLGVEPVSAIINKVR